MTEIERIESLLKEDKLDEAAEIADELYEDYKCDEALAAYDIIYDYICEKYGIGSEAAIRCTYQTALCHYRKGDFKEALTVLSAVISWYESKGRGKEKRPLEAALFIFDIYRYYNKIDEAEKLCRKGLTTALETYGESDWITISHIEKMGRICCIKGKVGEGIGFLERVLYLKIDNNEPDREIADAYDDLGRAYELTADYGKAVECYDNALSRLNIKEYPQLTFTYLKIQNDKASSLSNMYRNEEALEIAREVYRVSREYLPKDDPNICVAKSNIAAYHDDMGDYEKAAQIFRECLEWLEEHYGEEYNETLRVMRRLSSVYLKMGIKDKALELTQRVYQKKYEIFGSENDAVMYAYDEVGQCYEAMGYYENAKEIYYRIYKYMEKKYHGEDGHYKSLTAYLQACRDCGEYEDVITESERAIKEIKENKVLSKNYDMNNLLNLKASALDKMGRCSEAVALQREVVEDLGRKYGEEHPYTLNDTRDLIDFLQNDGKLEEAFDLSRRLVEIRTRKGITYPDPYSHRIQLADLCIDLGKYDMAGEILSAMETDRDIEKDGEHYCDFCYTNALLHKARGDREKALLYAEKAYKAGKNVLTEGSESVKKALTLAEKLKSTE